MSQHLETRQQVLIISTPTADMRSAADGWSAEDGWEAEPYVRDGKPVGLMGYFRSWYAYPTPYHALGEGWRLLAPPSKQDDGTWLWWLVRDVPKTSASAAFAELERVIRDAKLREGTETKR